MRSARRVGPVVGAGVRSSCVTHSPESQPYGLRTGFGGPTPPERTPAPDATRPGRTYDNCAWAQWAGQSAAVELGCALFAPRRVPLGLVLGELERGEAIEVYQRGVG